LHDLTFGEHETPHLTVKFSFFECSNPIFLTFSPEDKFILVSEFPVNGVNVIKIYEIETE